MIRRRRRGPRPRKIVVVGPLPPPYNGMSVFTQMVLSESRDASVRLIHVDTTDRRDYANLGRFDWTNVRLGIKSVVLLLAAILRHWPSIVYLPLSQNRWGFFRDACLIWMARLCRRRVVGHLHGSEFADRFYRTRSFLGRWWVRATCRRLSRVLVLGERLGSCFHGIVPDERVCSVPNGTWDLSVADRVRPLQRHLPGIRVVHIGSLRRRKGVFVMLEAARRVSRLHDGVEFFFHGEWRDPAERRLAERFVVEHGLVDVVHFPGPVAGRDKQNAYARADIFLFVPVEPEGMPLVVLEAMSAGTPIVATPQGVLPDILRNGRDVLFVPPGDAQSLEQAILTLVDRPALRWQMARRVRRLFLTHYTARRCVDRLMNVFEQVA